MRNLPLPVVDLQLSSPIPSPSRQSTPSSDTENTLHTLTDTSHADIPVSDNIDITTSQPTTPKSAVPSLQIDLPAVKNTSLYPLASKPTPIPLKRFFFQLDGKPSLFEEIPGNTSRKRSATLWDDDRAHKRTEILSQSADPLTEEPTISTLITSNTIDAVDIPDSPRSALPSPISDIDTSDAWIPSIEAADSQSSFSLLPPTHPHTSSLIDLYSNLPDNIQTYFMFQLLKRSPKNVLRMANMAAAQSLRIDYLTFLPSHLAHKILSYLDIRSLCRATLVNHTWKNIIDTATVVWKTKIADYNFSLSPTEECYLSTHSYSPTPNPLDMHSIYRNIHLSTDHMNHFKQIVRRHTILRRNWGRSHYRKMVLEGHGNAAITCLQFDEEKIITGSEDGRIHIYNIMTGKLAHVLRGHDGGVWALQYVNNTLVTGSTDRTIRVWDIEKALCRFVFRGHSSTVRCLKIVLPTNVNPDSEGHPIIEPSHPLIVSGSRDTTIRVWDLPDLNEPSMALSTVSEEESVSQDYLKYDALSKHENSVRDLAAYGNILVSGSYDCNVIIWDLEKGEKKFLLKGHSLKVYSVVIDPKNRHCISGSLDASVRIWGLDDGECKMVLQGHTSLVGILGLVDNYLVSAAADTTLRVWDASNGDRLHIMAGKTGHQATITTFQHDSQKIVSGSEGGVKVWDIKTGELLYDLIKDVNTVWRVCFDERRCVAAVKNDEVTQIVVLDFGFYGLEEENE